MGKSEIELNDEVLKRLKMRVYFMIKENHKTQRYGKNELTEKIRKMIEVMVENDN